jgi:acyl-CoA dehydrogenase
VLTSQELADMVATTRRFIATRISPVEQQVDDDDRIDPDLWKALIGESVSIGTYGANVPEDLGGPGLSIYEQTVLWEEFGHASWPFSYLLARPHRILFECSVEQRARYLDPVLRGEREQCFALTEAGAGSDNAVMATRAVKVDGGYVLNGTKHFISHGNADFAIVFAVTGPGPRRTPAVTAFLVDKGQPGYTIGARQHMMGWRGMEERELSFEDCFVPDEQVLGAPGEGLRLAFASVAQRRLQIAGFCIGMMERLLALSIGHTRGRVILDQPLSEKQGVRWMLADMATEPYIARAATHHAARLCDEARAEGRTDSELSLMFGKEISIAKLHASTALNRVADLAVQVHGGMGWCRDYPVERLYRDARVFRIIEGADEVHRGIIAKSLLPR